MLNPGFPRWAAVVLALIVALAAAGWAVFFSSWLGVREIKVEGTVVLTASEVRDVVALGADDALATVDTGAVATRVKKLPPVAQVEVRRSWPDTLVVEVTERTPVAIVQAQGKPWLIDRNGVRYAAASDAGDQTEGLLPLEVDDPSPDDDATLEAVAVIAALDLQTRQLVSSVSAPSATEVTLMLTDGREVIWGDSSRMNDKITMLPAVLGHAGSIYDISTPAAIVIK